MNYRLITSGEVCRREYFSINNSPLFKSLPSKDFSQEQKKSYQNFKENLSNLFDFYFPAKFSDYNNQIELTIEKIIWNDPQFTEDEVKDFLMSLEYQIDIVWIIKWHCSRMQFRPEGKNMAEILENWLKESFKVTRYNISQKSEEEWIINVKEKNNDYFKLIVYITSLEEERVSIKFDCEQKKQIEFCNLPKINKQGSFIINGHEKVVVFQSVRSPGLYSFIDENNKVYNEIIPLKGPWISLYYDSIKKKEGYSKPSIKIKFLNSGVNVNLFSLLNSVGVELSKEDIYVLFGDNEEVYNSIILGKNSEKKQVPPFLFNGNNSYFMLGEIGRNRLNKRLDILTRVANQKLAENIYDKNGKVILSKESIVSNENFHLLKKSFLSGEVQKIELPQFSEEDLYVFKVFSPKDSNKVVNILGQKDSTRKYFNSTDLLCSISSLVNSTNNVGLIQKEDDKDCLDNQIIRRIGDLLYNIFDNKLGSFLKNIDDKYLAYVSQLRRVDLTRIPNLRDFDKLVKNFFNSSTLIQLQNQNNPIAEASYTRKVSVLGLGGFNSVNSNLTVRNINPSYYGRYDLVETPEGQKVGLLHALSINAEIDKYGQIRVPYFKVVNGKVTSEIHYLVADEEFDKYISHCNVKIDKDNIINQNYLLARHKNEFVQIKTTDLNYIDSSFYHLNSVNSASIPFFQHNDSTRMLMACNMQKQAVVLLKNEAPFVATGIETSLLNNSALNVFSKTSGEVKYVDNQKVVVVDSTGEKFVHDIKQFVVSNKNNLFLSLPQVREGMKVEKDQILSYGNYGNKGELSLGYNLRVAFMCWNGYNFEDAIVVSDNLLKNDILTSFFVKKYIIIRKNTKYGEEIFSKDHLNKEKVINLDDEGIIKLGTEVHENDILVGKVTPEPGKKSETEELLLSNIFGDKLNNLFDSSFKLPWGEKGIVYNIKRWNKNDFNRIRKNNILNYTANDLEVLEIYIAQKRKLEIGDKLTTRFGNKGVISRIVPEVDMPFDEDGNSIDIIFNPLSVPSRMNIGQLLETLFGLAAYKLGENFIVRTFNTPTKEEIEKIVQEAKIKDYGLTTLYDGQTGLSFSHKIYVGYIYTIKLNHMVSDKFHARNTGPYSMIYQQPVKGRAQGGGQRVGEMEIWALEAHGAAFNIMEMMGSKSDDLVKRKMINHSLIFNDKQIDLLSNQSESFNLLLQYLRGLGFDLEITDKNEKKVDLYKFFARI